MTLTLDEKPENFSFQSERSICEVSEHEQKYICVMYAYLFWLSSPFYKDAHREKPRDYIWSIQIYRLWEIKINWNQTERSRFDKQTHSWFENTYERFLS